MVLLSAFTHELNTLLGVTGLIFALALILKRVRQPYIVAYILTGIILGPHGLQLVTDQAVASTLGELGLVMLMFFIGMEISLHDFVRKWKTALLGTGLQVLFSILVILVIGLLLDWSITRILLLGFIISLSSSAVVIKLIDDNHLHRTQIGQNVISILLTQDVLIVPMIIIMSFLGAGSIDGSQVVKQLIGGVLIMGLLIYLLRKKEMRLPFDGSLRSDHELQVFAGLIVCFGMALISSLFELSAGLGAFIAGLLVHNSSSCGWLHSSLHSFRVVLISVFFLSIGMLIDLEFIAHNWLVIVLLVIGVFLSNHGINAISIRSLGCPWKDSILGASLLAQIGEFSFVLASLGYRMGIIAEFTYQLTIIVISITILISPFWVQVTQILLGFRRPIESTT